MKELYDVRIGQSNRGQGGEGATGREIVLAENLEEAKLLADELIKGSNPDTFIKEVKKTDAATVTDEMIELIAKRYGVPRWLISP